LAQDVVGAEEFGEEEENGALEVQGEVQREDQGVFQGEA